ncbi:MAG: NAD-dependent epimerase/dehydratase family protein [Alkalispirochaeta sp.]
MNEQMTHVVLGAGGAISRAVVPELVRNGHTPILVSRSGTYLPGGRAVAADISDYNALLEIVPEGSTVYLLAGLTYDHRIWEEQWPRIMETVIRVCHEKGALLVFFDNVYMYGVVNGPMTEDTPHHPTTRKGAVRARIAEQMAEAWESEHIRGVIARSADFYGPGAEHTSPVNMLLVDRLIHGKKPQWLVDADMPHSLTYTTDCGRALALLVDDESAHNAVWHLPTAHPALTGREFVGLAAEIVDTPPRLSVLSKAKIRMGGLFDRTIREVAEMTYQNDRAYLFDSSRFESHFGFTPTSYEHGIRETINYHRQTDGS